MQLFVKKPYLFVKKSAKVEFPNTKLNKYIFIYYQKLY